MVSATFDQFILTSFYNTRTIQAKKTAPTVSFKNFLFLIKSYKYIY